jgi:hypothetical protein
MSKEVFRNAASGETRRKTLKKLGLLSAYSTPVILGVLPPKKAMAASGHANNGWGNGGNDGVPGNSNHSDIGR